MKNIVSNKQYSSGAWPYSNLNSNLKLDSKQNIINVYTNILEKISKCNKVTKESIFDSDLCNIISLSDYVDRILTYLAIPEQILILSLMNIDKLLKINKDYVNERNVYNIVLVSVALSGKLYLDECPHIKLFAKCGGVTTTEMVIYEIEFLELLNYQLFILDQEYNLYVQKLEDFYIKLLSSNTTKQLRDFEKFSRQDKIRLFFINEKKTENSRSEEGKEHSSENLIVVRRPE